MSALIKMVGKVHGAAVFSRRVRALAEAIAALVPEGSEILDVGCGDGTLGSLVADLQPGVSVRGLEIAPRPTTAIPVSAFDGRVIPAGDRSVDVVLFVDVLHHTTDPMILLREGARVARRAVIIKDHRTARPDAIATLRLMDWVGNRPHGVVLPYHYWGERRWREAWEGLRLDVDRFQTRLGLYPWPASWLFETGLHFVARLSRRD